MRRLLLLGSSALALVALVSGTPAAAQCAEALKKGTSFEFVTAGPAGKGGPKGTITVAKNDGTYIELLVKAGTESITMPGGIDGAQLIVTNPKNGNVWIAKCTGEGTLEGTSTMGGQPSKLSISKKK